MRGDFYLNNKTLHIVGCSSCGNTVKTTPKTNGFKSLEEVVGEKGMYFSFCETCFKHCEIVTK